MSSRSIENFTIFSTSASIGLRSVIVVVCGFEIGLPERFWDAHSSSGPIGLRYHLVMAIDIGFSRGVR
ncbi:MAG: hypothetical protein V3T49_09755 [Dehalococcoidia bacterium]